MSLSSSVAATAAPTVLPPAPRAVRVKGGRLRLAGGGAMWGVLGLRLFLVPFQSVGIVTAALFVFQLMAVAFGDDVQAHFIRGAMESAKKGRVPVIYFDYSAGGRVYTSHAQVDTPLYSRLVASTQPASPIATNQTAPPAPTPARAPATQPRRTSSNSRARSTASRPARGSGAGGARTTTRPAVATAPPAMTVPPNPKPTLFVHHYELGPLHTVNVITDSSPWTTAGFFLLFSTFWNAVILIPTWIVWVAPLQERALVRKGDATAGKITGTRTRWGKGAIYYYVTYSYADPQTGFDYTRTCLVGEAFYQSASNGQAVTVLFDPRRPKRSLIYEASSYEVMPEAAAVPT